MIGAVLLEAHRYTSEGRIGVGLVANTFAADSILLVSKLQRGGLEAGGNFQRCCVASEHLAVDGKVEVLELEGLGACFWRRRLEVFGGAEEPVETNDGEVDYVLLEGALFRGVDREGVAHALEDGEADRVGASGRVGAVGNGFEERSE